MRNMPADLACCRAFRVTKAIAPRLATVSTTCGTLAQRCSHSNQATPAFIPLLEWWRMQQRVTPGRGPPLTLAAPVYVSSNILCSGAANNLQGRALCCLRQERQPRHRGSRTTSDMVGGGGGGGCDSHLVAGCVVSPVQLRVVRQGLQWQWV